MTAEELITELKKLPQQASVGNFNPVFNEYHVIDKVEFVKDEAADTGYIQIYFNE